MSRIRTLVAELIIVVVLVGVLFALDAFERWSRPMPVQQAADQSTPELKQYTYESTITTPEGQSIPIITRDYAIHADIHVETPDLTGIADEAIVQSLTTQLNDFLKERVGEFTDRHIPDTRWLSAIDAFPSNTKIFYPEFEPTYHIGAVAYHPLRAPDILSIGFDEWYDAGLAHPAKAGYTFTFDLRTGEQLTLDNLFVTGDAFTQAVVGSIQTSGSRLPGPSYRCCVGTSTDFLVTDDGLAFLLDQGRVGGNIPVTEKVVPWDVLSMFVKTDSLLSETISGN